MPTPPQVSLRARIFDAFASRPRPEANQILRPGVGPDGNRLCEFLAAKTSDELSSHELRTEVAGKLWMLSPESFRYFLPAFMYVSLVCYSDASVFVSELVYALTEPSRTDIVEVLDRVAQMPPGLGLPAEMTELLRQQQLQHFDSGTPAAVFHDRVDSLTQAEGAAILAFFVALQEAHGGAYPFGELRNAIDRHWARYQA